MLDTHQQTWDPRTKCFFYLSKSCEEIATRKCSGATVLSFFSKRDELLQTLL
jgi:hypothetical protein